MDTRLLPWTPRRPCNIPLRLCYRPTVLQPILCLFQQTCAITTFVARVGPHTRSAVIMTRYRGPRDYGCLLVPQAGSYLRQAFHRTAAPPACGFCNAYSSCHHLLPHGRPGLACYTCWHRPARYGPAFRYCPRAPHLQHAGCTTRPLPGLFNRMKTPPPLDWIGWTQPSLALPPRFLGSLRQPVAPFSFITAWVLLDA